MSNALEKANATKYEPIIEGKEVLQFDKAAEHFRKCPFRPRKCCPVGVCDHPMVVDEKTVVAHLVTSHAHGVEDKR